MKRKNLTTLLGSVSLALVLVVVTIISACAQPAQPAPAPTPAPTPATTTPIKIGLLIPLTGPFGTLGEGIKNGFQLQMEGAGYKVAGRSIEIVMEDEGPGDPSLTMDKARKMVESDKIDIMVGPFNTDVRLPVLPYTSSHKVPNVACVLDTPEAVQFPYVYSPLQTVFCQTIPLGWFAYDELGVRTVTTIGNDWHAGYDFMDGFLYGFTKDRQGKVIQQQWTPIGTSDYSSLIVAMKKADAICEIFLVMDTVAFTTQAYQMGIKMPRLALGGGVLDVQLPELGPMLVDHYWNIPEYEVNYDGPANIKFKADYQAKYNAPADVFPASGYTAAQVILAALETTNGNADPDVLHQAVTELKLDACQGPISFTKGNPDKSGVQGIVVPFIDTIKLVDGKYVRVLVKEYPPQEPTQKP